MFDKTNKIAKFDNPIADNVEESYKFVVFGSNRDWEKWTCTPNLSKTVKQKKNMLNLKIRFCI